MKEKRKRQFIPPIAFCDEVTRRSCEIPVVVWSSNQRIPVYKVYWIP